MAKKNYRANNTYLIEGNEGDNPKLMGRAMDDGRDSLYLEYYFGKLETVSKGGRRYLKNERATELLSLYLWRAPRNPMERQQNNETLQIAKRIRFERGQELLESTEGYRLKKNNDVDLIDWLRAYVDNYTKGDIRVIRQALNVFIDFLIDPKGELQPDDAHVREERAAAIKAKEPLINKLKLKASRVNGQLIANFVTYLQRRFNGETPSTIFKRYKKMIKAAVEADVLRKNPCEGITISVDNGSLKKDVLSAEEMQRLMATHYPGENPEIQRAFIFCLYCGLRFCDVKELTFANVDFGNRLLKFEQAKTKGHSSASGVVIPLNEGLINLIGTGERDELIFKLPSHTMCLKALRVWTAKAGIDKHITWHCARHSFAVNILNNGANIKTVASLLGHSSLAHTEKYTRAVDALKEAAINSLPELKI